MASGRLKLLFPWGNKSIRTAKTKMNWFGKKKDNAAPSAVSSTSNNRGGGGGGSYGGATNRTTTANTVVSLRENIATQEKR